MSEILSLLKALIRTFAFIVGIGAVGFAILAGIYFPYDYDQPTAAVYTEIADDAQDFYEEVYSPTDTPQEDGTDDHEYVRFGQEAN